MKSRTIAILLISVIVLPAHAQRLNGKDIINKLCGCFEVSFKYAETFSPDPSYTFHEREKISGAIELSLPIEVSDKKIVIQHLLVINDSVIVKHWREDWVYENPEIWNYTENHTWKKQVLQPGQVKGKWTQSVWEVSDAPRYQGFSQFVWLDNRIVWQSTADAPLPRREYTTRSDYNILKRTNRLNITDSGYVHEQDNQKIVRTNGADKLLAEEKGLNTYKRVADGKCDAARGYWTKNKAYWEKVRNVWVAWLKTHQTISLKKEVEGRPLHAHLNGLMYQFTDFGLSEAEVEGKIRSAIEQFVQKDEKVAVK